MADIALESKAARRPIREATRWDQLRANRNWLGFWFMLPAMAFLILFLAYPLGLGVWISFTDARIGRTGNFIGIENYEWLWDDSIFWLSVFNTLLYTTVASAIKFAIGLYLALLLNENMPLKAMLRALVLIPFIVPTVLSALAFWWIFDSQFSIISWSLKPMGLITDNINFLGDVTWARICVIFANIWRGVPFVAITLLAGLQTVSPSLYEAATLDGATSWQRFRFITYPLLTPIIAVVDVFGAVHLHRLPADLGDDARRPGQCHAFDGDAVLSARDHRRHPWRGRGDIECDDSVPAGGDHGLMVRTAAPQMAAGRKQ
jgi:multiple sugar transport system permease protein